MLTIFYDQSTSLRSVGHFLSLYHSCFPDHFEFLDLRLVRKELYQANKLEKNCTSHVEEYAQVELWFQK